MKKGTYKVKAKGHGSSFMPMEVTLSEEKIEAIKVDAKGETKGVADEVFHRLPNQIVKNQTLNVDAISGATISSHGVIDGVAEAIDEAGGDSANTKMCQKYNTYWPEIQDDMATTNSPAITGDGIKLGQSVGAALTGMGFIQLMPVSDPVTGELFTGLQTPPENYIMVNQKGARFVNEYAERDTLARAAIKEGGLFYLIADDKIKETAYNTTQESIDAQVKAGTLYRADTLEELAKKAGMDPATLVDSIKKYNSYAWC